MLVVARPEDWRVNTVFATPAAIQNPNNTINYRILSNKISCAIRNEKKHYVETEIQQKEGQPDKAWKALKYLLPIKNKA